ncbi:hypothetical protein Hanom_Chr03g00225161 [Helianthus anomalus]
MTKRNVSGLKARFSNLNPTINLTFMFNKLIGIQPLPFTLISNCTRSIIRFIVFFACLIRSFGFIHLLFIVKLILFNFVNLIVFFLLDYMLFIVIFLFLFTHCGFLRLNIFPT